MFDHICNFKIQKPENVDLEELEFEMIDFGVEEIFEDEDGIVLIAPFENYGTIFKSLEEGGYEIISSEFERIPQTTKELTEEQKADIEKLLEKFDEDEDVNNVYHTMKEDEEEEE